MRNPRPVPQPATHDDDFQQVSAATVLANFADEIGVAIGICVNVEEIIADRMIEGAPESDFVRVELQNVDRLIQMLADFRSLAVCLGASSDGSLINADDIRKCLLMEELRRRLLSPTPTRTPSCKPNASDVTFF